MINPINSSLLNQYQVNSKSTGGEDSNSFLNILSHAEALFNNAENNMINNINGNSSTIDMVQSMLTAERNLQTILAYRDKITNALQEISRIQI